jgi:uncharacterized membrane protein (DUF4010 family)
MLLRNGAIVALLAPAAFTRTVVPFALMVLAAVAPVLWRRRGRGDAPAESTESAVEHPLTTLRSPFSLTAAFRFGVIFLVLHVTGTLAARGLGEVGEYAVSAVGGLVSSASAVASAAALGASNTITPTASGLAAILASLTSAAITVPFIARIVGDRRLTRQIVASLGGIVAAAAIGVVVQAGVLAAIAGR